MPEPVEPVYFVHLSDTHFGPTRDYGRDGHLSYPCGLRLVEVINSLPTKPDFVVHSGDVVADPDPVSYMLAAEVFAGLNVPIYYVTGNHDAAQMIQTLLPMGERELLVNDPGVLCYQFEVKGYRFLILDGRGPDEIEPHGLLSEEQLSIVRHETSGGVLPLTVFVHFPVLPMNSPWMDEYMLLLNGEALHEALLPARERLRGVFYGHVHQSIQTVKDGISYTAVPSTFSQFTAWPTDVITGYDPDYLPGYNFVHLLPDQTIVHQHTFVRP